MSLDIFDAIALTIHANNDNEITNKTTIQKLIYFHTQMIENLDISNYTCNFYGPFNYTISTALQDMLDFSYITQNIISNYYEIYNYKLTEKGIKYAETAKEKYSKEFEIITNTLKICNEHCELKHNVLSYAAKAFYILANSKDFQDGNYSTEDIKMITNNLDWSVVSTNNGDVSTGIKLLEKLHLVSIS